MSWYAIYESASGILREVTTRPPSLPDGFAEASLTHQPDWAAEVWDAATHSLVPKIQTKTEVEGNVLSQPYSNWRMWADTVAEATARAMPAAVISSLKARVDAAWTAYATAINKWRQAQ